MNRLTRLALLLVCPALLLAADPAKPADQPVDQPAKPADQPAKPAEQPAKSASATDATKPSQPTPADKEAIALPKVEVTSARIKAIDAELKAIDKQIAREKKNLKSTKLDETLNSDKASKAAAIFGGNSASHMVAVAATRVNLLESERAMLERLKFPRTEEDQAMIEKEIENLRETRRNLDDAAKQR